MSTKIYNVADLFFKIVLPEGDTLAEKIQNYDPFIYNEKDKDGDDLLFSLEVIEKPLQVEEGTLVRHFDDDTAIIDVYIYENGDYRFLIISPEDGNQTTLYIDADIKKAKAYIEATLGEDRLFGFNNSIMMLYAFAGAIEKAVLMHASVIGNNNYGYLFLGKSGTGKSTHSRLWLENIDGSELINDDNPVVRVKDNGEVWVYGSPWSGKTPCYRNVSAKVKAFVRIQQAPATEIKEDSPVRAFASLLPSCSSMRWDSKRHGGICSTVSAIIESVKIYKLPCLPNKEAAELCHKTVSL
jgi:hypothetical protein